MKTFRIIFMLIIIFTLSVVYLGNVTNIALDTFKTYSYYQKYSQNQFTLEMIYNPSTIKELDERNYFTVQKQKQFLEELYKNEIIPYFIYQKNDAEVVDNRIFITGLDLVYSDQKLYNDDALVGTKTNLTKENKYRYFDQMLNQEVVYDIKGLIKPGINIFSEFIGRPLNLDDEVVVYESFETSGMEIFHGTYQTNKSQTEVKQIVDQALKTSDLDKYPLKVNFYNQEIEYYKNEISLILKNNLIQFISAIIIMMTVIQLLIRKYFNENNYAFAIKLLLYKDNKELMIELLLKALLIIILDLILVAFIYNYLQISLNIILTLLLLLFIVMILITIIVYTLKIKIVNQIRPKQ